MGIIKKIAENVFGYRIEKLPPLGSNPYKDISSFIESDNGIVVLDVGANQGQSVVQLKKYFDSATIHCFEPNKTAFKTLKTNYGLDKNVMINDFALGSAPEQKEFYENELSDMSSFLELGKKGWGKIDHSEKIEIKTLDSYCKQHNLDEIDILKIDVQGFELEVLMGASKTLPNIRAVLMEVTFAEIYQDLPSFDKLYKLMRQSGFRLVSFYQQHYHNGLISWTDVLFVNLNHINK